MGLTITGGTTISNGQTVSISSYTYTQPAGANPTLSTAARNAMLDALTALLGAGAVLRIKTAVGGTTLVDLPLNTGASGPFDAASGGASALDVSPAISATASAGGVAAYYEFRTSGGTVVWSGTSIA